MKLSSNFKLEEFLFSQTAIRRGIDNTPTEEHKNNMIALCQNVLQPVREIIDVPVRVSSGYRSEALNEAIGGSTRSQHSKGEAADINAVGWSAYDLCCFIRDMDYPYDQLIYEGTWVHVSHKRNGVQRKQILTAHFENGYVWYSEGLEE